MPREIATSSCSVSSSSRRLGSSARRKTSSVASPVRPMMTTVASFCTAPTRSPPESRDERRESRETVLSRLSSLVLRRIWHREIRGRFRLAAWVDGAGVDDDAVVVVDLDGHPVQRARGRAAAVLPVRGVDAAVAGAAELLAARNPGHRATQVDALPIEGDQPVFGVDEVELAERLLERIA